MNRARGEGSGCRRFKSSLGFCFEATLLFLKTLVNLGCGMKGRGGESFVSGYRRLQTNRTGGITNI